MSGTYNTLGGGEEYETYTNCNPKPEGEVTCHSQVIVGRIRLKLIKNKYTTLWSGLLWLRTSSKSCERISASPLPIKGAELLY
jgi:hypothetical protein